MAEALLIGIYINTLIIAYYTSEIYKNKKK